MTPYSAIAPRNLPTMIWKSVSGDVSSSSMVPDRFSSAYARIVTMGMRKRIRISTFCSSGRISCWLTFIACGPCMPNWPICMLWRTKKLRMATKK